MTLTAGPTAVPPPWEKINVDPMSIYTWPRNFSRQPLNFNQKFMKVLICAWLCLSCSIPFNHLSLICLGCCAEPPRPDTNCGGLVWWENDESVMLTEQYFLSETRTPFSVKLVKPSGNIIVLMVDNSRCVEVSQLMVIISTTFYLVIWYSPASCRSCDEDLLLARIFNFRWSYSDAYWLLYYMNFLPWYVDATRLFSS